MEQVLEVALKYLKGFTVERFTHNGVPSVLVYNTPKRPKKFRLILNGHLDVVPGKPYQYVPTIKGKKLYGVGSMDMKANVACLVFAFKELASKVSYPLALQLTTDEEIGGFNGTKYQVDQGVRADFVLAGEPTNFDIVHEAKGVSWLRISAVGKTAHGAYPWRGDNAILKINQFLYRLQKIYPTPKQQAWVTTVNISSISTSNKSFNKIPDDCILEIDTRFIAKDSKSFLPKIQKLLPKGCSLEVVTNEPALFTPKTNEFVQLLSTITARVIKKNIVLRGAQGTSDARHFARVGGQGIEFGPIGGDIGSDHEWVDLPSLAKYYEILKEFLLQLAK